MTNSRAIEIPVDSARDWVTQSLAGGHEVSAAVLQAVRFDDGVFRAILPDGFDPGHLPDFEGGGLGRVASRPTLARVLEDMVEHHAACVVVEDDLALRTDPGVERSDEPLAFIGERVISWCDLGPGVGSAAAEVVDGTGSGYPTNAFVVSRLAAELGLSAGRSMPDDFGGEIVRGLLAVVVSAFDDESFVIWTES